MHFIQTIKNKFISFFDLSLKEALFSYFLSVLIFSLFKLVPPLRPYVILVVLLYLPVISSKIHGFDYFDYGLKHIDVKKSLKYFLLSSIIIFPPYILLILVFKFGFDFSHLDFKLPKDIVYFAFYNIIVVGISEEFFYRGYIQSLIQKKYNKMVIKAVDLDTGVLITSILFGAGHFLTYFTFFSFLTFLPSLIFGILKNKTNNILASALFHGVSNAVLYVIVFNIGKII